MHVELDAYNYRLPLRCWTKRNNSPQHGAWGIDFILG